MTVRVLGLDLSTRSTGIATPDGRVRCVRPISDDNERRRNEIKTRLEPYLRLGVDLAVIEQYSPIGRGGPWTLIRLAELGGAIKDQLFEHCIPFVEVSPSRLKKFAVGFGGSSKQPVPKQQLLDAAVECGVAAANDDESDAWWLHAMGRMRFDEKWQPPFRSIELREIRLAVLADVEWPALEVGAVR